MTTYRNIHGRSIQAVTTDPTGDITEGQIWYNTTSDTFKSVIASEAWASAASLITARQAVGGIGTQSANLVVGGYVSAESTLVEEYNGSGWSVGGALPAAKNSGGGFGTQTAGVYAGGGVSPNSTATNTSQEYNGTSWTASPGNLNTTRDQTAGAGTETAGLCCGGTPNGSAQTNTSEEYNGSTWTAGNNLSTAVRSVNNNSLGIQTAALLVGGNSGSATTTVQSYDGTNWTATTVLPEARISLATSGTQTAGLAFGGNDGSNIESTNLKFDGSSWTALPTMGTARDGLGGSPSGTSSAAIASGGRQPGPANSFLSEEFTSSANVITAGAYSAGPTLDTNRRRGAGWGSMTSAVIAGGQNPSGLTNSSSEFNGSSWTAGGSMNNARQELGALGATESAGIVFGGEPNPLGTAVESYNGSSWTTTTSFPTAMKFGRMHAGPSTAGIASGGSTPTGSGGDDSNGNFHDSHDWNGSSWTANTDMPFANQGGSAGSQTATVQSGGGYLVSPSIRMLDWNGSSWTAGASAVSGTDSYLVVGTQSAFVVGTSNPPATLTQVGDGTTIATGPSFAVDKTGKSGIGSSSSLNGAGGGEPGPVNTFEEFTAGSTTLNVKTLTQS